MSGFQTNNTDHLTRSNVWSTQLKEVFQDSLMAIGYVDMITDFTDGETFNIASLGQAEALDYAEGQAVRYTAMDTGNFTFSIDNYKSSATYVTNKQKQDSFLMSQIISQFVPLQERAIMKAVESNVLALGPNAQTAGNANQINGADHRFVGTGTNETIAPKDFAKALYALQKANVPTNNLIAIVDPSVEYSINTLTNISDASNNPRWEGIIESGMSTGTRFIKNIFGFDVYVSQNLKQGVAETIGAKTTTTAAANLFFSADSTALPFVGSIRQAPTVDSEYNKDLQRDEYVTTSRYGFKLYRPENMVVVLTDTDQV